MFSSDLAADRISTGVTRRAFVVGASAAAIGMALWSRHQPGEVEAVVPIAAAVEVDIVQFSAAGTRQGTVHVAKIVKSEREWKQLLSANAFDITRRADTEIPFVGKYWNLHDRGLYRCICCDTALFSSNEKFDSDTGWPSFWAPLAKENVATKTDKSFGMERNAVACRRCDAHLGHVFNDGPLRTGLRYCMNSASLQFSKFA